MGWVAIVLASTCCACAVTASTCPVGTKLVGEQRKDGRAQWCEVSESHRNAMPGPGRSYESTFGFVQPTGMPGGIEGPFTSWYPNGTLAAHGSYLHFGARSVPHGLWTFWYPDGRRRTLGQYHRGQPQGCFAAWDEAGQRKTGTLEGDVLRVADCTPPADDEVVAIERGAKETTSPASYDFHLLGMAGPNRIGAANHMQVAQDPGMTVALSAAARKHLGPLRVGPLVGARIANEAGYLAFAFGATAAWRLPSFHSRIDTELAVDLAVERISIANAQRRMQRGVASLALWSPLPALQANMAIALSPNIDAVVGARVDGIPARDVDTDLIYCDYFGCVGPVRETWSVGGISYGIVLGLRLAVR
jgi:hypothetical protein